MVRAVPEWFKRQWHLASAHRANARAALRGNWGIAIVVAELAQVLSATSEGSPTIRIGGETPLRVIVPYSLGPILHEILGLSMPVVRVICAALLVVGFLIHGALLVGLARYDLDLIDGKPASWKSLFSGFPGFRRALLMHLIREALLFLGRPLVIPAMVVYYGLAFAPCILAEDPECTGWQALRRSWQLMGGHKRELLFLEATFLGWIFLSHQIGSFAAMLLTPYLDAARTSFYRELNREPVI